MEIMGYSAAGTPDPFGSHDRPIRRRNRMIHSCLECRKRKLKCSKAAPACTNCIEHGRECLYLGTRLDTASQIRLKEIKERQGSLERELERDVAKSTATRNGESSQRNLADEVDDEHDKDRDLEATPLVALDLTYEDDADNADDMIDLGIQIGKMRITERIGGLSRPRIAEELAIGIAGQHMSVPERPAQPTVYAPYPLNSGSDRLNTPGPDMPDYLRPGNDYLVPTSGFYFSQLPTSHHDPTSLITFLPNRTAADILLEHYFHAIHRIAPCTHGPSLRVAYSMFWADIDQGFEPRESTQALIFAALFSAVVSMDDAAIRHKIAFTKRQWVEHLKLGTESALSRANFLRTTRIETLQAFVMYMLPLCRAEVSRAHSVLVASAVRAAECMGLHRDGEAYGLNPVDTHVRRLIWHQLCFLDIRTCEAQGPKPIIRREDYDTKLPLNCNEDELTHMVPAPANSDSWTTNTIALIRFEVNEMMRSIWLDRRRLETRKTTLTAVLAKVEHFRRRMSEKYDHMLDMDDPLQRYARIIMHLLTYRLHVMVLHPYYANASSAMPAKLSHLLITSGILIVELAMQLETNPNFDCFKWYLGAYFQYQIALLLATEVHYNPQSREVPRICFCLDYVFGLDPRLTPEAKCLQVLSEAVEKTNVYMRMRKVRGPTGVIRATPAHHAVAGTSKGKQREQKHGSNLLHGPHAAFPTPPSSGSSSAAHNPGIQSYAPYSPASSTSQHPSMAPPVQPISSVPQPQIIEWAGVCDGQALWSLPSNHHSSPGGSDMGGVATNQYAAAGTSQDNIMDTIDWDTMSGLFPTDPQTGAFSAQGFLDPNFGLLCDWQHQQPHMVPAHGYP